MKGKSDFVFLAILGLLISNAVFYAFFEGYILSINSYFGIACWAIIVLLRIIKPQIGKYAVAVLLITGTLNIINFGLGKTAFSVGISGFETPGLDPLILFILITYWIVNRKSIGTILSNFFHGNADDRQMILQKKIDFYCKKFNECDDTEFEAIFSNLKEYPEEAQIALNQIQIERKSGTA